MKYCQHCGAEIHDEAVICVKCGRSVETAKSSSSNSSTTLLIIAKVFMIISCVVMPSFGLLYGFITISAASVAVMAATAAASTFIILGVMVIVFCCVPLAWMIPMVINLNKKIKSGEPLGIAFKICTLLFVNTIAGILLLCHSDSN